MKVLQRALPICLIIHQRFMRFRLLLPKGKIVLSALPLRYHSCAIVRILPQPAHGLLDLGACFI